MAAWLCATARHHRRSATHLTDGPSGASRWRQPAGLRRGDDPDRRVVRNEWSDSVRLVLQVTGLGLSEGEQGLVVVVGDLQCSDVRGPCPPKIGRHRGPSVGFFGSDGAPARRSCRPSARCRPTATPHRTSAHATAAATVRSGSGGVTSGGCQPRPSPTKCSAPRLRSDRPGWRSRLV